MKIIVTGCKGQLGTEIIKQLREGRSEIGPIPEKLMNATVIPVDLPELDISNYKMVDDFIRRRHNMYWHFCTILQPGNLQIQLHLILPR